MARFRVNFMKTVCGDIGQEVEICQRTVVVKAADRVSAIEAAIPLFCNLENVGKWVTHADRIQVDQNRSGRAVQCRRTDIRRCKD